jgi:hypothetical protein
MATSTVREAPAPAYSYASEVTFGGLVAAVIAVTLAWRPSGAPLAVSVGLATFAALVLHFSLQYRRAQKSMALTVDGYSGQTASMVSGAGVSMMHFLSAGLTSLSPEPIALASEDSSYMEGLILTHRKAEDEAPLKIRMSRKKGTIIVGTLRMGFGHHRIANSACSWGLKEGVNTYFHDLLGIQSNEAQLIHSADKMYSRASRLASELGGPIERLWGMMTLSGNINSCRQQWQLAQSLMALMMDLPKNIPVIASHSLVGMVAVACGFEVVINCVIDNWAQWFIVVPGALNLVQSPSLYMALRKMGVPASDLRYAGHWVPASLVDNIPSDCAIRASRAADGLPRRLLIPIGGAGAQRKFVLGLVKRLEAPIREGLVTVYLNAGDHKHMHKAFERLLSKIDLDFNVVRDLQGLKAACDRQEPVSPITLFAFSEYFPSVAATDMLMRVSDVLVCKPSELAFYPIPKLMIRRVGDHEAWSAIRASELGEGTIEVRELDDAEQWVQLLAEEDDLFLLMNDHVLKANSVGVYDGSKNAVELARKLAAGDTV